MQTKNTRLVYVDEKNLKVYQSLPNEDFKEFFMTLLTYQDGDDVSKTISNPLVQTLFMAAYADKIVYNEEKWEKKAKAARENGKKGGRKPKNSPNEAIEDQNDIVVPQEEESVSEAPKQGEFDDAIEVFSNGYSDKLEDYLDEYENIIRQATDIIANSTVNPCNGSEYSVMFHKDKLRRMMDHFGTNTKDAIDFKNYIDEEISRKITEKRYEKATA